MFNPSRDQVRDFFIQTWKKYNEQQTLSDIEAIALDWILKHPEYHNILNNPEASDMDFNVEKGQVNPFLHLSMHLAIAEQISINHPHGIRDAYNNLAKRSDEHHAIHEIMECLGQVLWEAQRLNKPLDSDNYLELIRMRTTRQ